MLNLFYFTLFFADYFLIITSLLPNFPLTELFSECINSKL